MPHDDRLHRGDRSVTASLATGSTVVIEA